MVIRFKTVCVLMALLLVPSHLFAQRGRGGFRGGGGGYRGGAARSMPSRSYHPAISRSPSMSRSSTRPQAATARRPSANRSLPPGQRTPLGRVATPGSGLALAARTPGSAANRLASPIGPAAIGAQRSYQRPSAGQLNSFLNLPGSTTSATRSASGNPNLNTRTIETPGGSTITVGAGRGTTTGPGGAQVGGAGMGVVVQGPDGQVAVRGRGAVAGTDGQNKAVARGSGAAVQDRQGNTAVAGRGGAVATDGTNLVAGGGARAGVRTASGGSAVAGRGFRAATDGQNTVVRGGSGAVVQDRYGNTQIAARRGTFATDGTNVYRSGTAVRAIRDPAGNIVATGRAAATYNGALVARRQFIGVRNGFTGYRWYYTPGWYARYPRAWVAAGIATAAWWSGAYWGDASDYSQCSGEPVSYDYGDTVTYQDGGVYSGDEMVATEEEYYEQATEIAAAGDATEDEDWLPLGVFAVVTEGQETTDKVLQLAVNREGAVRGNLHDMVIDEVIQVSGSVDRQTQRVAFSPMDKETPVAECGLYNLTQNALTALVHFDRDRTEQRTLIRLEQPSETQPGEAPSR